MVSSLANIIQHEQHYLVTLLIDLKAATLLNKGPGTCFPVNFCKISRNNFFYRTHLGTAFGLSFANPRKKSMKKLVC